MDFQHEDRSFFNRNYYESLDLHNNSNIDRYLGYFLELMRDYGLFTNYSRANFEIAQFPNNRYLITNKQTGERFFNQQEFIYRANPFHLIKSKYLQNCNSSLCTIIDILSQQSSINRSNLLTFTKTTSNGDSIQNEKENFPQINE